jgi:hypothetical protein
MVTLTLILGLYFDLWVFVDLFGEFSTDIAKVGHWNAGIVEPFLCLLQLIVRELQLTEQVSDALGQSSPREEMTTQDEPLAARQSLYHT